MVEFLVALLAVGGGGGGAFAAPQEFQVKLGTEHVQQRRIERDALEHRALISPVQRRVGRPRANQVHVVGQRVQSEIGSAVVQTQPQTARWFQPIKNPNKREKETLHFTATFYTLPEGLGFGTFWTRRRRRRPAERRRR